MECENEMNILNRAHCPSFYLVTQRGSFCNTYRILFGEVTYLLFVDDRIMNSWGVTHSMSPWYWSQAHFLPFAEYYGDFKALFQVFSPLILTKLCEIVVHFVTGKETVLSSVFFPWYYSSGSYYYSSPRIHWRPPRHKGHSITLK